MHYMHYIYIYIIFVCVCSNYNMISDFWLDLQWSGGESRRNNCKILRHITTFNPNTLEAEVGMFSLVWEWIAGQHQNKNKSQKQNQIRCMTAFSVIWRTEFEKSSQRSRDFLRSQHASTMTSRRKVTSDMNEACLVHKFLCSQ